jgi:hypothetical protein
VLLEKILVLPERHKVVVVKDHIGQLRVELVLIEIPVDLLEVGQERIFLQLEIYIAFSEPGLG